jgi:hypothetical protein
MIVVSEVVLVSFTLIVFCMRVVLIRKVGTPFHF